MMGFGVFLVLDSLVLHLITFNYEEVNLGWLDSKLDHWMIGVGLVALGGYAFKKQETRKRK